VASLRELQRDFFRALTGSEPGADAELLRLVRGDGTLGPAERLAIYADMYQARLLDVLREDFPRALAVLGEEAFADLTRRYLTRHPSTHPSVRHVGRHFADHLATEMLPRPYLADLARLEWARVQVFDAPDPEPLRLSDLEALAPAEWPALRLRPIAACRIVDAGWPVHTIWAAAADLDLEPAPTTIRVWREGWSVSHAAMAPAEVRAFRAIERGEPFAQVCAAIEWEDEPQAAAHAVGGVLMRWLEDGCLTR
jgi:hypothetical protein